MGGVDHLRRLGIEGMGFEIGREDAAVAVRDVGALADDGVAGRLGAGLLGLGRGEHAHAHADRGEEHQERGAEHQEAPLGAGAGTVAHLLVAKAQVLAFDGVRVFPLGTGAQDAGEGAERGADHSGSIPERSAESETVLLSGGSGGSG